MPSIFYPTKIPNRQSNKTKAISDIQSITEFLKNFAINYIKDEAIEKPKRAHLQNLI